MKSVINIYQIYKKINAEIDKYVDWTIIIRVKSPEFYFDSQGWIIYTNDILTIKNYLKKAITNDP